jgi:uncharacterized protein YjdB
MRWADFCLYAGNSPLACVPSTEWTLVDTKLMRTKDLYLSPIRAMFAAFNPGNIAPRRRLSICAGFALAAFALGCGGSSDLTGPPGGGGGGGGGGTQAVASVSVSPTSAALLVGGSDSVTLGTTTLVATPKDASGTALSGRTVTWSSSSTSVATVTSAGVVTGVAPGTATITATSEGRTAQVPVTVTRPAVASVTMAPTTSTLLVGVVDSTTLGAATLTATPKDAAGHVLSGRAVTWTSGTPAVATVSSTGAVKAVSSGSSNVTASVEGQSAVVPITVVRPPVSTVSVVPQSSSLKVGATETLVVTLLDAQSHQLTGRLIATVNNTPSIITVTGGQITGVAAGTGSVNYSSEGVTTVATIAVTP